MLPSTVAFFSTFFPIGFREPSIKYSVNSPGFYTRSAAQAVSHYDVSSDITPSLFSMAMALFLRQIVTLTNKNLLIALVRHWFSTPFRAFLLPCVFIGFLQVQS